MWKTKMALLVAAASVLFTACAGETTGGEGELLLYEGGVSGSAVSGSAVAGEEEQYETVPVRKEDYQELYSDTAEMEYTDINTVYIDEEDAVLDSVKVKKDQHVKKGDVLAVFHLETSETKLEKQKLQNQQARANYESGLSSLKNSLSQLQEEYEHLTASSEKKQKSLEIKKMESEIEAYEEGEKEIKEQEKQYAKLVRMQSKTNLVAKKAGVVTEVGREYVGEEVDSSKKIVELRNNDKWTLKVKDPEGKLRYNMEVSVRLGKTLNDFEYEVRGKVISAGDITGVDETDESGDNIIYIEVSEADKKKYDFQNNNIYVQAVSFEVKDALLVDQRAVYSESVGYTNKYYVWVYEEGNLHKRFIVSNYQNEEEYLVEQGVSENQTLAIVE